MSNSIVWAWPASLTLCAIDGTAATIPCLGTWSWLLILYCCNYVWKPGKDNVRLIFVRDGAYKYEESKLGYYKGQVVTSASSS